MSNPAETPPPSADFRVNFFRPRAGFMRREVRIIWAMLAGWALLTFGFPLYLIWTQTNPRGVSPLTSATLFGFPCHYWFSGQFLVLWFILLSFLFNVLVDRLIDRSRHPRPMGGSPHVH